MSRIDDIVNYLQNFLAGNDHSGSPQLQQAVEIYAEACNSLNEQLAQCRQLIACGLIADARKLDMEHTPSLSTRAGKLQMEESSMKQLRELCSLYGYQVIPELDHHTLKTLAGENGNLQLDELIMRWRTVARKGSLPEKIKLLRNILKYSPASADMWLNNLHSVEQQWVMELQQQAEIAAQSNDGKKLTEIFNHLADPELQTAVPETTLQRFRPQVQRYQQEMLQNELAELRKKIFTSYSALDSARTAELLREYDLLLTSPHYQFDPAAEAAVGEVRNYLQKQEQERNRQNLFAVKSAELTAELDKHGDFAVIDNLYEALKQLDIPLEKNLAARVENRRQEYAEECHRKHVRKCIYGILSGVLLLTLCAVTFSAVQNLRSYRHYRSAMIDLLNKGNFQGVIKLHSEVGRQSPVLLKFGQLSAIKAEAEKLLQNQNERFKKIAALCVAAEVVFKQSNTPDNLAELRRIKQALDSLEKSDIPAELAERCRLFEFNLNERQRQMQKKHDEDFSGKLTDISRQLDEAMKSLQKIDCDLPDLRTRITLLLNQANAVIQNAEPVVSADLLAGEKKLLEQRCKNLQVMLQRTAERWEIQNNLLRPSSFQVYIDTLKKLPSAAPDWANGDWKLAVKKQPQIQAMALVTALTPGYETREKLDEAMNFIRQSYQLEINQNCFLRDVEKLTPERNFTARISQMYNDLNNSLSALYNCSEMCFKDADNISWNFYSTENPILDRGQTSRIPKAIALNVLLKPGSDGVFLPIRVVKNPKDQLLFFPGKIPGVALPDTFTELKNMSPAAAAVPRSAHGMLLEDFLRNLKRVQTPQELENTVFQVLKKLQNADNMNIFARAQLTRKIMDLLPAISVFYTNMSSAAAVELDNIAINLYDRWYMPTIHAEYALQVKQLEKFFARFKPETLQVYARHEQTLHAAALSRALIPAGIILKKSGQAPRIHWFSNADTKGEFWVHTQGSGPNADGWIAYPPETVKKDLSLSIDDKSWYNGMVVFFPADGENSGKLSEKHKKIFSQDGFDNIIWPANWPLNCR